MTAPSYDTDNIFAKILRGDLPCHKVYEDDATFAFMDIMPRADGHTLVIPKNASRNMLDVKQADLNAIMATVQKIAKAQMQAFDADGITLQQFNEPAGGQVVFHLHMHVIPRQDGISLRPHTGEMADNDLLATHAQALKEALEKIG
ncbi:MAG: HIT family protein [Cohaesibacter sp.]|nr:HIT family protein [Cohaesibacter sp.]MCV6603037.1 HIT family protein [Cohaesibacter sp.]